MLHPPIGRKGVPFFSMVEVYTSSYPHSPRPFSLLKAWRLACCWAAAWSARCWNWSQVGTSLGPWGACAGGGSPWNPPVSAAWLAWCSLGPGSPARGWCDGSTPAAGKSNDKKPWTGNCVKTTGVALISLGTVYFDVCCQKDSATSRTCKEKFAIIFGSTFGFYKTSPFPTMLSSTACCSTANPTCLRHSFHIIRTKSCPQITVKL